jgi:ABC-type multidrug transport system permease subunit
MIVYWICNFRPNAEAFFKFILILYLTISAAQSTGLFMSVAIPSTPLALVIAPFVTLCLMIIGGFYIPFEEIHPALSWASWLSMARYGFSAFIINEFDGRFIECDHATNSQMISTGECPLDGSLVVEYYGIKGAWTSIWANVAILVIIQVVLRCATYFILLKAK